MSDGRLSGALRHLGGAALLHGSALSDGQLLERFLRDRDEPAFEALVRRHGPMVFGVCRRVLGDSHDAEDAFQATFLALVRKAASLASRELVGHWLYGVAHRTALYCRRTASRRRAVEKQVQHMPEREVVDPEPRHDLRRLLDQELSRLPGVYRLPVVLCELGGKTRQEVARQLGVPEGTVSSRLARGRELLRKRLTRQGLTLTGAALALGLTEAASGAPPTALLRVTVEAGVLVAAGRGGAVSAPVACLLRGVLRQMALAKFRGAALVVLAVGLLGLAAGLAAHQIVGEKPPDLAAVAAPAPRPAVEPGRVVEFGPVAAVRLGDIDFPRYPHQLEMANVNGTLFFPADGADGPALWKCGATPDGPKAELVKACGPASDDFAPVPGFLTDVNGTLFFVPGGGHGNELWKSDGTEAGTVLVKRFEFSRHNKDLRFLSRPVAVGKTVFFTHGNGKGNCGLWKSDGTEAGTVLVKGGIEGIYLHANYPRTAAVVNGTLFFVAYADGESGLWKTDGTPEGTALLRRVDTAHHIRWPYYLTDFNGTLFFLAAGPDRGLGLWKSDGTAAGTGMVKEINPSHDNTGLHPDIGNLTVVGRTLFFVANDGVHGRKPWKSDGTAAGTMMVKDVSPAPFIPMTAWRLNVRLDAMAGVDGVLFFVSDDGTLWKSDGTEAGTVPVKRIASYLGQDPRGVSPNCASLTNVNGLLYCAVDDDGDFKLWRSDGTEAGTVLVTERKYDRNWIKLVGNRLAAVTPIGGATFFTTARLSETRPETLRMELWHVPAPR